jgi:hypothetical protein
MRRIFGIERKARLPGRPLSPRAAAGYALSGGIPPHIAMREPTRSRASDTCMLISSIVGSVASVLALFIEPRF